jgi:hypothetical protein
LINLAFALLILRISGIFKLKSEDFWFYMFTLNLVAILLFVSEYFEIANHYSFVKRFLCIMIPTFGIMEFFKKPIVNSFKLLIKKLPHD